VRQVRRGAKTEQEALSGPRVQLRPPRWEEMAFVRWLWADPETMRPVGGPVLLSDEEARRWFARMVDPGSPTDFYCLIYNEKNQPIGEISLHHLDREGMEANFNVKIAAPFQGQGYAREAMGVFLGDFFHRLGGRAIVDDVALDNEAGQQVLLRFGFKHDPSATDVFRLRMTREWFESRFTRKERKPR
jgi:RimJ/RimL family protein N-acetyltransferase